MFEISEKYAVYEKTLKAAANSNYIFFGIIVLLCAGLVWAFISWWQNIKYDAEKDDSAETTKSVKKQKVSGALLYCFLFLL